MGGEFTSVISGKTPYGDSMKQKKNRTRVGRKRGRAHKKGGWKNWEQSLLSKVEISAQPINRGIG